MGKAWGGQNGPGALGWGQNRAQDMHLPSQSGVGGTPKLRRAGAERPFEKRWPEGTPWMKVGPWKMGTSPSSGEDELIPVEANQSSPLGRQKRLLPGQNCRDIEQLPRKEARPSLGPWPYAPGAPPWLEKETRGALGGTQKPEGVGAVCCLVEMGHAPGKTG